MDESLVTFLKSRTVFPESIRASLCDDKTNCFVTTLSPDSGSIHCYSTSEWEKVTNKISWLPDRNPTVRTLKRRVLSHAVVVEMNAEGWVAIPGGLKQACNITSKGLLVPGDHCYELWNPAAYENTKVITDRRWVKTLFSLF